MAVFAVHLNQLGLEIVTDVGEDGTKSGDGITVKYPIAILSDEDQVNMKLKDAMSTVPNVA
jgi:putative transposase